VAWCRFFVPKIASPYVKPDDPDLNEHIMYAKCVKGHVLSDAKDWILCENLPSPDAKCWQEGGETLFTLTARKRNAAKQTTDANKESTQSDNAAPARK
jgi:hypothetical protein